MRRDNAKLVERCSILDIAIACAWRLSVTTVNHVPWTVIASGDRLLHRPERTDPGRALPRDDLVHANREVVRARGPLDDRARARRTESLRGAGLRDEDET